MAENIGKKLVLTHDDSPPHSLNMPIFKNNKRIFLNQLEKYTSDLLIHLEELDFSGPQELSQITDVLSDEQKSEVKNNILENSENKALELGLFPKLYSEKKDNIASNLYYERKGYRNYKYKFLDIETDDVGRFQKLGKKFDVRKHLQDNSNEKVKSLDTKSRDHKKKKNNNLLILSKKLKKFSIGEPFFQELEINESLDETKHEKSTFPKIMPSKSSFGLLNDSTLKNKDNFNDRINHLINITNKSGVSMVKCDKNSKDPLIVENYALMNKIIDPIENAANNDNLMKIQLNNLSMAKLFHKFNFLFDLKEEKFSIESKKEINILNEFMMLSRNDNHNDKTTHNDKKGEKNLLTLEKLKEFFVIFKENENDINNRILLAFGLNPYNNQSKLNWETYLKFKRVIVLREASLKENTEFVLNYFNPDKKESIEFEEFRVVLRNLCNKIDQHLDMQETLIYDYLIENVELSESILKGKVITGRFKKALLNLTLHYKYFINLIVKIYN